jgi:hypothetical protein
MKNGGLAAAELIELGKEISGRGGLLGEQPFCEPADPIGLAKADGGRLDREPFGKERAGLETPPRQPFRKIFSSCRHLLKQQLCEKDTPVVGFPGDLVPENIFWRSAPNSPVLPRLFGGDDDVVVAHLKQTGEVA